MVSSFLSRAVRRTDRASGATEPDRRSIPRPRESEPEPTGGAGLRQAPVSTSVEESSRRGRDDAPPSGKRAAESLGRWQGNCGDANRRRR
jgi:hypothetical protein